MLLEASWCFGFVRIRLDPTSNMHVWHFEWIRADKHEQKSLSLRTRCQDSVPVHPASLTSGAPECAIAEHGSCIALATIVCHLEQREGEAAKTNLRNRSSACSQGHMHTKTRRC